MKALLDLFIIFCKVGALTFGGGYAMMPILQKEVVEREKWATQEEIMDYYAISQCTPGIIAVNTAIFLGHKIKKIPGAIAASLGIVTPSIIIITVIAMFLQNIMEIAIVQRAFMGVRVAVCALVAQAAWTMVKKGAVDKATTVIFVICAGIMLFTSLSPIPIVIATAVAGIVIKSVGIGEKA